MNKSVERFLFWLASVDGRARDISAIRDFLERTDPLAVDSWVRHLRDTASLRDFELNVYPISAAARTVEELEMLLRLETNLSASEAGRTLNAFLVKKHGRGRVPEFRPREGLKHYLERLFAEFSERELLSSAHAIRNNYIQGRPIDWPLNVPRPEDT